MDPQNAAQMVENLAAGLGEQDPSHAEEYERNAQSAVKRLESWDAQLRQTLAEAGSMGGLITFHDGFQYFAKAYDLKLLAAIEEEAGSEASAREILDISQLVKEYALPVIFTEVNGSDATAKAIARETGCAVAQLSMCMDGPDDRLENYYDALMGNAAAIANGLSGAEGGRA
jgi:ABC-type Zn uptake system ZnuABC Zn-binding protein ZnuA